MTETTANYDQTWKEAIGEYFELFIQFFYPNLHEKIDWSKTPISLDKELEQITASSHDIINLIKFIDKMMTLPPPLQTEFNDKLEQHEKELNMPFLSTIEEMAQERGEAKGKQLGARENCQNNIIKILANRFDSVPELMSDSLKKIEDMTILENLLLSSISVNSWEEFQKLIDAELQPKQ
ncbi:hypothetical protein IQ226_22135 [Dolichospermum sp. LEGE 00240]|uniref:hypothetical protein n=1 Tax=Dolichospermum sp. LEGE 00240 TaxID=1828603 RepID=UPI0018814F17|nr:hypothetical protein [Dolichospermum sp. LEGE 00240]MBE9251756.1 hypothetical protein [Dolichospermum sp. LEGE 00240]MDM3845751.1 hypothetical protein [Aphanizomenon gracile PMC638.10]MDM3855212.1 hypothetical protein [Aphanizomenon gracile PMC649.10]